MISACSSTLTAKIPIAFHIMKWLAHLPWLLRAMTRKRTLDDPEGGAMLAEMQSSVVHQLSQRLPAQTTTSRIRGDPSTIQLEQIRVPALIVHGTADEAVPFEQSESLANRLPNAELVRLEGGKHISLFTHLSEIRRRVRQFLSAYCEPASERRPGSSDRPWVQSG